MLRIDQANELFGLRINVWVAICVAVGACFVFAKLNKDGADNLR